jgi:hypothetical protein
VSDSRRLAAARAGAVLLVWLTACSPASLHAAGDGPRAACTVGGAFTGTLRSVALQRASTDEMVSRAPAFSFALAADWRTATSADVEGLEIHQAATNPHRTAKQAQHDALKNTRVAPFAHLIGQTTDALWLATVVGTATVLTNPSGAFVSLETTDNPSMAAFSRGCRLGEADRALLWSELTTAVEKATKGSVKMELDSIEVKEYDNATGLRLVYTRMHPMGSVLWTVVQFRSEKSIVTFRHGATTSNPMNGLDDFERAARTFKFLDSPH